MPSYRGEVISSDHIMPRMLVEGHIFCNEI